MKLCIYFFCLSGLILFSTCKKYPEGGKHWGAKNILTIHYWYFDKRFINGVDSTSIADSCILNAKINFKQFKKEFVCSLPCYFSGTWDLEGHKAIISFGRPMEGPLGKVFFFSGTNGKLEKWTILKLTDDEFKLKNDYTRKNTYYI